MLVAFEGLFDAGDSATSALRWLADETTTHSPLIVHFQGGQGHARIDPQCETVCFRIAQEALTNAVRHGGATRVVLQLRIDDDKVWLQVDDNGAGFDVDAAIQVASHGRSMGLLGMRERASLLGGEFTLDSHPGRGTRIAVVIPCQTNWSIPEQGAQENGHTPAAGG